jgi:hypothetical protein
VDRDGEVSAYLAGRGLDPATLADLDLCRALPGDVDLPTWTRGPGGMWTTTGHRLVCPLYDARGQLRSVIARRVHDGDDPKSLAPSGHERRGLVMADGLARQLLATGARPGWWDEDVELVVVLTEGEPDWLSWATSPAALRDLGHGPACMGLLNGSLPAEMANKLPTGTRVLIAEQRDLPGDNGRPPAGETYTARILRALDQRRRRGELVVEIARPK